MRCCFFFLFLFLTSTLCAENAWIEPQNQGFSVLYGQKAPESYSPEKVKEIKALITKGLLPVYLKPQDKQMDFNIEGKPVLITLYFDDGFWSKTADKKWLNLPKNVVQNAQKTTHAHKFAKTILQWQEIAFSSVGQLLEIVPRKREDGELIFQVLFEGNPLANATIFHNSIQQPQKTNEQGLAKIILTPKEKHLITVEHILKTAEVETDENSWTANILFFEE